MKKLIKRTAATVFAVGMLVLASMETRELGADPIIIGWPWGDQCSLTGGSGPLCGILCHTFYSWDPVRRIWVPLRTCYFVHECTAQDGLACVAPRH